MSSLDDPQLEHLIRLPWTIVREVTPEGDHILRVAEIPSVVGSGADSKEMEADLWESLRESLRAYLHFGDPVPMPTGPKPDWFGAARFVARTPFVLRVPDVAVTATAAALIGPSGEHAA